MTALQQWWTVRLEQEAKSLLFNGLRVELDHLEPGLDATEIVGVMRQGLNDFERFGYGGPCPPPGHGVHHYHFVLLALEVEKLPVDGPVCAEIEKAARTHALAEAECIGTYER